MPKMAFFERSRRELSLDVSIGVHILLVMEQSSLESQCRGCAKTRILTVNRAQHDGELGGVPAVVRGTAIYRQ